MIRVDYEDLTATEKLANDLRENLPKNKKVKIVCIGTDRSTGDSLGPLIGTKLNEKGIEAYGTLDDPVHAINLDEFIKKIDIHGEYILAIDSCLGKSDNVGTICYKEGSLKPGSAVYKDLPSIGNSHIYGVVNVGGFLEYSVLQNTRLNLVMKQAIIIANAIEMALVR